MSRQHDRKLNYSDFVSASEVGRAAYCPRYLEHKAKGAEVGKHAIARRKAGEIGHDEFNRASAEDRRCYIASHLYGNYDPRTDSLREFRDRYLQGSYIGRRFIACYYRHSPALVSLCERSRVINALVSVPVNLAVAVALTFCATNRRYKDGS
jgi:hypothetical protein